MDLAFTIFSQSTYMYGQVFMWKIVNVFERHAYSFEE